MIPKLMESYLRERLPQSTWENRLERVDGMCFIELTAIDVDRLARLGIEVDSLGPQQVICLWDEAAPLEVGGYLVVDNLAMGRPSMGGIRMLPDIVPATVHNLARGMTLKNAAANLPFGGGKAGLVASPDLPPEAHRQVVERFACLIGRFRDIYIPGPDVGTNDADMGSVAVINGLDHAVSKPASMGGNRIDQLGAAGEGLVIALDAMLDELPRLRSLPQCAGMSFPRPLTVLIQGFGAVGAHAARALPKRLPDARVVGISDAAGYLYDEQGLPVEALFEMYQAQGIVTRPYFLEQISRSVPGASASLKYSSQPNDLLRESAFCLIPAAPVANYLDTDLATHPSMTVDRMGKWRLIVEGANTYSPDPARKAARSRMERAVYRERGTLIATDYLVNSGGVIFAAQERLIKTPGELRIPGEMLGDRVAIEGWLHEHATALEALAEERRMAGEAYREEVIRRNMRELVDLLVSDADMLPAEAAERLSVRRIASRESDRTAFEIMAPIPTLPSTATVREAAMRLVEAGCPILAVVGPDGELEGVVTEWDITRAAANESGPTRGEQPVAAVMTRQVIAASPEDAILELVRKLEHHEISALPVVQAGKVQGMVSADVLARRSLYRLLQSQVY